MSSVLGATKLEKVWESRLRENYVTITGEVAPPDLPLVVKGLEIHFAKQTPADRLTTCDVCGGWSDEELPSCPYCMDGDAHAPRRRKVSPGAPALMTGGDMARRKPNDIPVDACGASRPESGTLLAKAANGSAAPSLQTVSPGKLLASEQELDGEIAAFRADIADAAKGWKSAGARLKTMRDRLWQQRTGEDGKPKYKSFEQFCRDEFGISKSYASKLIDASEYTEQQIDAIGITKLALVSSAPATERPLLLQMAEAGAPRRELERAVADANAREHEENSAAAKEQRAPEPKKRGRPRGPQKSPKQRERETREACEKLVAENADKRFATIFVPKRAKSKLARYERTDKPVEWVATLPSKSARNVLRVSVRMDRLGVHPDWITFEVIDVEEDA